MDNMNEDMNLVILLLENFSKNDLKQTCKGVYGETVISVELDGLTSYPLLRNYVFSNNYGNTCEVDTIMFDTTGIYVIESKNYCGWIYGNENQLKWIQFLGKNKTQFFNPIMQTRRHILVLNQILNIPVKCFYNMVIFGENYCMSN